MSNTETLVMNADALGEIITESNTYLTGLNLDEDDVWQMGFTACMQMVETVAAPIVEACEPEYGDAEGPVMNQAALNRIVAYCLGQYEDNSVTGNHDSTWLLGLCAGIQRLEMFGGDIVADCT